MSTAARNKRDRERARQEKAAIKRDRRQSGAAVDESGPAEPVSTLPRVPQGELLASLAALHETFDRHAISFEDFEVAKRRLVEQIALS